MTNDAAFPTDRPAPAREPWRVRLPGFIAEEEVGLGDFVKKATSAVGIRPCAPCEDRARHLNNWLVFTGRR